jgi:predicted enzyme related to lactoylglutathione lyase
MQHTGRMEITSATVGLPVTDLAAARDWYERVFEVTAPPLEPADDIVEYEIGPIWLQLAKGTDAAAAGSSTVLRLGVDDVDAEHRRLQELGVPTGRVVHVPGAVDFFDFRDPFGNVLSLYTMVE